MSNLFWPGDERAGALMSDASFIEAMVRVEDAWLSSLVSSGIAPSSASAPLTSLVTTQDVDVVATGAEAGGNPVIGLVALLRSRATDEAARWVHHGLTSQDVVDTALQLLLRDVLARVDAELRAQIEAAAALAEQHVSTPVVGRTLTQHAVPTTFGAVVSTWLDGLLDAADAVHGCRDSVSAQLGGAVGTLASLTELARLRDDADPAGVAIGVAESASRILGLRPSRPWHTSRARVTRIGDALVSCTDAWGHIATDVATASRSEIGELSEPHAPGRGGSSTMPHKQNPVLSVLVRRAAIAAPPLGATLHTASALAGDQRPDGAWHTEWATLRTLARRTAVAGSQTTELLQGLEVDTARMDTTLTTALPGVLAERRSTAHLLDAADDPDPSTYLGVTARLVADAVARARAHLQEDA